MLRYIALRLGTYYTSRTFCFCSLTDSSGGTTFDSCGLWEDPDSGTIYAYYYPNEDDTQYLYETFPEVRVILVVRAIFFFVIKIVMCSLC